MYSNVFVTVGTTKFDDLCTSITSNEILRSLFTLGCRDLVIQIGKSDLKTSEYEKEGINVSMYSLKNSIAEDIKRADLVISHAGAGTCLEVLEAGKPLLVVVNEDLMDNHQLELAEQLQVDGHLYYCTCSTLQSTLLDCDFRCLIKFPKADPILFINYLNNAFVCKGS